MSMGTENQIEVLDAALGIADYSAVAEGALSVIDAMPALSERDKYAIRAMAYWIQVNITLEGRYILLKIMTATWESIGIQGATPLTLEMRQGIVGVIMGVAVSIITAEAARLVAVAGLDTSFPEPDPEPEPEE